MIVLLVEDDLDVRLLARLALAELAGYEVHEAGNGIEALARIAAEIPDLILLDVTMPEMDGLAVLDHIRSDPRMASTPVVMLTASVRPREIDDYLRRGATGVLKKPFDPMKLVGQVNKILTKARRSS